MPDQLPTMTPTPHSSNIAAVGHGDGCLFVRFRPKPGETQGPLYRYRGVSQAHAPAMIAAESPGAYFHKVIRGARVPGEKIEEGR